MESRDDDELPWDPLWAYVLGEDENDNIVVVEERRDSDKQQMMRSLGRPPALPKGRGFWQKGDSQNSNQGWAWEFDPAIFSSTTSNNGSSRPQPPADEMVVSANKVETPTKKDSTDQWQWELDPAFFTCGTDSTVSDPPSLLKAEAMKRTVSRILPFGSKQK